MLLSFPHMGNIHFPLTRVCQVLDIPYLLPSPPGPKALALGQELAPEGSCLPFLLVLGNMREALDQGADTILMLGGSGPCRFGYFVYLADKLLKDAGYEFQMLIVDKGHHLENYTFLKKEREIKLSQIISAVQYGWELLNCQDMVERMEREYFPAVCEPLKFKEELAYYRKRIEEACSRTDLKSLRKGMVENLENTPRRPVESVLRIGLVGDIYTMLEPQANQHIEEYLLSKGICIYKDMAVTKWIPNVFLPWRKSKYKRHLLKESYPYLCNSVGGFGLESVASTCKLGKNEVDGIIQLFPLGCMPEIVARSALNKICKEERLPVMSITMDQHQSMTGFQTRLEAFLDLVQNKKEAPSAS